MKSPALNPRARFPKSILQEIYRPRPSFYMTKPNRPTKLAPGAPKKTRVMLVGSDCSPIRRHPDGTEERVKLVLTPLKATVDKDNF